MIDLELVQLDHDVNLPKYYFHANKPLRCTPDMAAFLCQEHGAKRLSPKKREAVKREVAVRAMAPKSAPPVAAATKAETPEDKK